MRTVIIFCLCLFTFTVQAQDDVNYTYMDSLFSAAAGSVGER